MKIINIPIEPIEERYSIQWDKWFKESFDEHKIDYVTVYGNKTSGKINVGSFLDVIETNQYKVDQLSKIIKILKKYDNKEPLILFFHDLWFPGLETIAYIRDGLGLNNLKICGCLHAGSYDIYDFLNKKEMSIWAMHMENGWFGGIVDKIFVATNYHRTLLVSNRNVPGWMVNVTGFPFFPDFIKKTTTPMNNRRNIVVFPHRLDSEKNPDMFDAIANRMQNRNYVWWKTKNITLSKYEYYECLQESRIALSFSYQETWGIAMQEAVICGAIPLCPDRLSYTEMYSDVFLYKDELELVEKIDKFMHFPPTGSLHVQQGNILEKGMNAIPNMIKIMQTL
jgi:hypothetical protein